MLLRLVNLREPYGRGTERPALVALEMGLFHEMWNSRGHVINDRDRIDSTRDKARLAEKNPSVQNLKRRVCYLTHSGISCFADRTERLRRSSLCSLVAPTLPNVAKSFRRLIAAS